MKTLTVHIKDDKQAALLETLLNAMDFVESVESHEEEEVSQEVINMLNESMVEYERNPEKSKSWEEVKQHMTEKYGVKF